MLTLMRAVTVGRIIAIPLLAVSAPAAESWVRLKSPNFELLSQAGEKKGREAILHFEQVRSFFAAAMKSGVSTPLPVRIIGFSAEREFRPYRPTEFAAAFYQAGHSHDTIVMSELGADRFPIAVHEYVHLLVQHSGLKIPVWLNEGMAELYSTLKQIGKQVQVGALIPGRFQMLHSEKWIPLAVIATTGLLSPHYNDKDRAGMFYSQSWALTHMLSLDARYRPSYPALVEQLHKGVNAADAFQKIYAKSIVDVDKDLQAYVRGDRFNAALFNIRLEKLAETPSSEPAPQFDVDMALAGLLDGRKAAEARARYEALANAHPQRPEPHEALANLDLRAGDRERAASRFARAFELGAANPKTLWNYALMLQGPESSERVIPVLEKLASLDATHVQARLMLADRYSRRREYVRAVSTLREIKSVKPEDADRLFLSLAYAGYQAGDLAEAAAAADRLRKLAKTPEEIERAQRVYDMVTRKPDPETPRARPQVARLKEPGRAEQERDPEDRPELKRRAPPESTFTVEEKKKETVSEDATLVQVDCLGAQARLVVADGGKRKSFLIDDPRRVVIRNTGSVTVDFTCGPQKPRKVSIEFLPGADAKHGTAGLVRGLDFRE